MNHLLLMFAAGLIIPVALDSAWRIVDGRVHQRISNRDAAAFYGGLLIILVTGLLGAFR